MSITWGSRDSSVTFRLDAICACYFWLDPKVTKRSRLRLLRYSLPALRCSHRKLASLKQRCSRTLRSGRSLDAHQPRPIPSSLAFGIGAPHHIFSPRHSEWSSERAESKNLLRRMVVETQYFASQMHAGDVMTSGLEKLPCCRGAPRRGEGLQ